MPETNTPVRPRLEPRTAGFRGDNGISPSRDLNERCRSASPPGMVPLGYDVVARAIFDQMESSDQNSWPKNNKV